MWGWGCTFTVSPTAILFYAVESEQLVVAIDLLHAVTLPSTTLCASFCLCVWAGFFIHIYICRHLYSCLHVHFMYFTYVWMSIHIVCLNARLSGGQLASPSQRTAPGAMPEVPTKSFFCCFFPSRSLTVDSYPPHGPARGLPAWGGALPAKGEGEDRIWQRLCVLVGVRVCVCEGLVQRQPQEPMDWRSFLIASILSFHLPMF